MSLTAVTASPVTDRPAPTPSKTLRDLFLTLFLRGRASRGLQKNSAPKSIGSKLAVSLGFYCLFGCIAFVLFGQPVFALSVYLHVMTFVFLGMFVAASAGEILFNKEESDILLHRPITASALLWAKVRVLVEVSLWLAGAFNLAGLVAGYLAPDGGWRFPIVHAVSTSLEAIFCTGCVVLVYQLCLRFFGRERLEGLMTSAQVAVSIAAVLIGQIVPQFMFRMGHVVHFNATAWWIAMLPPSWFAGLDDALAGSAAKSSWLLAGLAVSATAAVCWAALDKLASDYETGLQRLSETSAAPVRRRGAQRWIDILVGAPPLKWWLRDSVARASFLLTASYLTRDRDVKLRVYPGIAPILILPIIGLIQRHASSPGGTKSTFFVGFAGAYLAVIPVLTLSILKYSQNWQAADVFRAAPMPGPAAIYDGARRAVICFIGIPMILLMAALVWIVFHDVSKIVLLLPGAILMPLFSLLPSLSNDMVPLSQPSEEAKSAKRGLLMIGSTLASGALTAVAGLAWSFGVYGWMILAEVIISAIVFVVLRSYAAHVRWESLE